MSELEGIYQGVPRPSGKVVWRDQANALLEDVFRDEPPFVGPGAATSWLKSAADLLAQPDPGPTPFAIEGLLVDGAVAAIQGPPKAGKTWLVLELAIGLVSGRAVLDRFDVPEPGPAMLILEESGEEALRRRLGMLMRGRAAEAVELVQLYCAANLRVRLNNPEWQERLVEAGREIRPKAVVFDPLALLKGSQVDENVQREMGPVLDFMRLLRDETGAAIVFVHHTGHEGGRLRGSSDLEAYWETKITVTRSDGVCRLSAEHREAEATPEVSYRLGFDTDTRSVRLTTIELDEPASTPLGDRIAEWLADHPAASIDQVRDGVRARRQDVKDALESDGRFERVEPPPGAPHAAKCFSLLEQPVPLPGMGEDGTSAAHPARNPSGGGRDPFRGLPDGTGVRGEPIPDADELDIGTAPMDELRARLEQDDTA